MIDAPAIVQHEQQISREEVLRVYASCRYGDGIRHHETSYLSRITDAADHYGLTTFAADLEGYANQAEELQRQEEIQLARGQRDLERSLMATC